VASERERTRCRERLERLAESSLDCESVQREAIADLRRVIGFDRWCWPLADPETLLPLSGLAEHDYGQGLRRALELEYAGSDFAAKHDLARRGNAAGSLSSETGGDLARSSRWDEVLRPVGIGDLAAAACADALGCWGWIEAYRDDDDRRFEDDELELLASVARSLGTVLRRSLTARIYGPAAKTSTPGVILLKADLGVISCTEPAREWIDALPAARMFAEWNMLPATVYPVATRARSRATAGAHALERAVDGRWVMIEAGELEGDGEAFIAVTLRHATPEEIFDLLSRAYALTRRERDVVRGVLGGLDTRAIADRLVISPHTVQDHLKSVFEKIGTHSRRELLAIFNVR
jgi:DNA-binding CsgD family transcriptional regulator